MRAMLDPLEQKLEDDLRKIAARSEMGYEKSSTLYLMGEGPRDYRKHMRECYKEMAKVLDNRSNPEAAAKLRTTLEREYEQVTMP
jgi:hypothetical protein